jgi:hypothetical protein
MALEARYKYANAYIIYRKIKLVMRDQERGEMSRESAAECLRMYADELEERVYPSEQMELIALDDVAVRVRQHLADNSRHTPSISSWKAK